MKIFATRPLQQRWPESEIEFLVGKIDGRFHQDAQLGDLRLQLVRRCAENSPCMERTAARAAAAAAGVDQIRDGFGLRDVDLAVQKGALAEFAGPRHAAAELEQPLQQQDRAPTMPPWPCSSKTCSPV